MIFPLFFIDSVMLNLFQVLPDLFCFLFGGGMEGGGVLSRMSLTWLPLQDDSEEKAVVKLSRSILLGGDREIGGLILLTLIFSIS